MIDVAVAFGAVFVAEVGDKTQLVVLSLAGKYSALRLLLALAVAIAVLQTLSVSLGAVASTLLPASVIGVVAGLLFIGFGIWTWASARAPEAPDEEAGTGPPRELAAVAAAFFVAELGDKTMLTTAGLAADRSIVAVWIGSFLAMMAAVALAVVASQTLLKRVPPRTFQTVAAVVFVLLGMVTLVGAVIG